MRARVCSESQTLTVIFVPKVEYAVNPTKAVNGVRSASTLVTASAVLGRHASIDMNALSAGSKIVTDICAVSEDSAVNSLSDTRVNVSRPNGLDMKAPQLRTVSGRCPTQEFSPPARAASVPVTNKIFFSDVRALFPPDGDLLLISSLTRNHKHWALS